MTNDYERFVLQVAGLNKIPVAVICIKFSVAALKKFRYNLIVIVTVSLTGLISCYSEKPDLVFSADKTDSTYLVCAANAVDYNFFELTIKNNAADNADFFITPVAVNLFNDSLIVLSLLNDIRSDKEKCFTLWKFITEWTYHNTPASRINTQLHDPAILLNAFQYGYCDDRNIVLAMLANSAGIKSRIYNLNGHVVAEMFYDSSWHMFDADKNLIYLTSDNEVAGIAYLTSHAELIDLKSKELKHFFDRYRNRKTKIVLQTVNDNYMEPVDAAGVNRYNTAVSLSRGESLKMACRRTNSLTQWFWIDAIRRNGPYYRSEGLLTRKIELNETQTEGGQPYYAAEFFPYPIHEVTVSCSGSYNIYYSTDKTHWYFKGQTSDIKSSITFAPLNAIGDGFTFSYCLKIVPLIHSALNPVTIVNRFTFSDRVLVNNKEQTFRVMPLNDCAHSLNVQFLQK